jgi:formate hydrogenlyase subunit 3/multisubunit Na+/H+ antiporter MnhD subunit
MPLSLTLAAVAGAILSSLMSLLLRGRLGRRLAACLCALSCAAGLAGVLSALLDPGAAPPCLSLSWPALGAALSFRLDALSAFFAAPVFVVGGLGAVYGHGYLDAHSRPFAAPWMGFFWGLMVAAMALLVLAADAPAFLLAWELMALSAFFLVGADHAVEPGARKAALLYLLCTHAATLALFAAFALLKSGSGSFSFVRGVLDNADPLLRGAVTALLLFAFSVKAGLMPLHLWLPDAHAHAPSHVSALMSGVMIKMGVYGLFRTAWLMPGMAPAWGGLLLALGCLSAVLGVLNALGQHDLKRLLAWHSVENIGIIVTGLGLALLGRALDLPLMTALGLAGALFHVWNHALFKSALFLSAGAVIRAQGTRELDRMGGLSKGMPVTALCFLLGAWAICGLPVMNGFASEFLVYRGALCSLAPGPAWLAFAALSAVALATAGALAAACFVKAYGSVFLGRPRKGTPVPLRDAPASMLAAMLILVGACLALGLAPNLMLGGLGAVASVWDPSLSLAAVQGSLDGLSLAMPVLALALFAAGALVAFGPFMFKAAQETWACAFPDVPARAQYSASSLADSLLRQFTVLLGSRHEGARMEGHFPGPAAFHSRTADLAYERGVVPVYLGLRRAALGLRGLQQGGMPRYLIYVMALLAVLLLNLLPIRAWMEGLF